MISTDSTSVASVVSRFPVEDQFMVSLFLCFLSNSCNYSFGYVQLRASPWHTSRLIQHEKALHSFFVTHSLWILFSLLFIVLYLTRSWQNFCIQYCIHLIRMTEIPLVWIPPMALWTATDVTFKLFVCTNTYSVDCLTSNRMLT